MISYHVSPSPKETSHTPWASLNSRFGGVTEKLVVTAIRAPGYFSRSRALLIRQSDITRISEEHMEIG
jgi:hypothetical protein